MSEPFLSEIRIFGFNFAPQGWAFCDGQLLPINQNQSLYSLLGTAFGGDGETTFALPDLRGRVPLHPDGALARGERDGEETVPLTTAQMPTHDHGLRASAEVASDVAPQSNLLAKKRRFGPDVYAAPSAPTALDPSSIANAGAGQGHSNLQPSLALTFCIALQGVFPS
jgi:microcystin-dependent protein